MSAEMAVEFLLPEQQANIYLCEAPLVEGTMAAAVQAMGTNDVHLVLAEARGALAAKTELLLPVLSLPELATETQFLTLNRQIKPRHWPSRFQIGWDCMPALRPS